MVTVEELLDSLSTNYLAQDLYVEAWRLIHSAIAAARAEGVAEGAEEAKPKIAESTEKLIDWIIAMMPPYEGANPEWGRKVAPLPCPEGEAMTSLESIVLPLEQSRALVEHGIVLDTAMVWFVMTEGSFCQKVFPIGEVPYDPGVSYELVSAPTLSELLDAIRAKVGNPLDERTIVLAQDGHREVTCRAEVRYERSEKVIAKIAYNDTDLLAAAALLMEVAK